MSQWNQKISAFILRHSFLFIILFIVLALRLLFVLPKIEIDSGADIFFDKQGQSYVQLQDWEEQFGSDERIVIAFSDQDIFTAANLTLISTLSERLESLEYVDHVRSLTTVNNISGRDNDFIVEKLIEEIPAEKNALAQLKSLALGNPLYARNIISEDARTTAIVVELEASPSKDKTYKKDVLENISSLLQEDGFVDQTYYLSGLPVIEYFFAAYMKKDLSVFVPLMFVVITGILYLMFRQIKIVILPLICIIISLICTMVLFYFFGFSINNVTTTVPPILMAIAIADSIHFIGEGMDQKQASSEENVSLGETMQRLIFPCFLTTATTTIGFLSLSLNRIAPVRQLGMVAGIGIVFAFIITFTFLPSLIKQFKLFANVKGHKETFFQKISDDFFNQLGAFNEKHTLAILIGTVFLIGLSVAGLLKIKTETSVLEYFKKDSPIFQSTTFIEENISGVHAINISLKSEALDYFKRPEVLMQMEALEKFLHTIKEVDSVTSIVDYIKDINQSFHNENAEFYKIPASKNLIAQYLLLYGQEDLEDFVDSQWQWATMRVHLKEHSTIRLSKIMRKIDNYLDAYQKEKGWAEVSMVGQTVLEVESNNTVTKGQLKSLGLAMIVIFGMMFVVFHSIQVGLVSIIPNVLPLLINFGIMGWLGIRLDSATSMISAIGIGIVVDDTIHFLHAFGESLKETGDYTKAMYNTLVRKGRPIMLTSLILFFGFGVVAFSNFVPTSYFGLLSALIMLNALFADLIILPCILMYFKPKFA